MAVSNQEVADWLRANPMASDAEIAQAAAAAGVSAQQLSLVTGVPVDQVLSRAQAAAPEVQLNPGSWNYDEYQKALRTGGDLGEQVQKLATQNPDLAAAAGNLYGEITAQQQAGSDEFWYAGNTAGKEYAAADFALRLAENGITSLNQLGQATVPGVDGPEQQVTINKVTGQPLPRPELLGRGTRGLDIDYNLAFTENGQVIPYTSNRESSWMSFRENALKPAAAFALTAFGAPLIGAAVAPGLAAATQGAIGGAIAGGGAAALTGNDILTGALLGAGGGYLSGSMAGPAQDSIYSLANGTPNLDYMGGGQGLLSTGSANLASMGGAQGLQILAGLPSTTLAEALNSFAGVNPSVLSDMGLGTGITYVTPSGIVTENGTIIGGDVIGELGKNTGFDLTNWLNENVGAGIGDQLGQIDTGIGGGTPVTGVQTGTTGTGTGITTGTGTGITVGKVLDAVKLGGAVAGLVGAGTQPGNTGFGIVPVPSDWTSPIYGQPTGPAQGLSPIDFGSRELLRGTQWEKYLNPMQPAMAPAPQTGMNYNQLMNTLQGGQGGSLSLNDIISGIQGQYGQTPAGTVG